MRLLAVAVLLYTLLRIFAKYQESQLNSGIQDP